MIFDDQVDLCRIRAGGVGRHRLGVDQRRQELLIPGGEVGSNARQLGVQAVDLFHRDRMLFEAAQRHARRVDTCSSHDVLQPFIARWSADDDLAPGRALTGRGHCAPVVHGFRARLQDGHTSMGE